MTNGSTAAETILVVDDSEGVREVVSLVLCRAGYRVLTACNGDHALRLANGHGPIDLLVTDIEMPRMRGDELASHFARLHPGAGIIFVSSSRTPIERPAQSEFITKPFHIDHLRQTVRRALRRRMAAADESAAA